MDNKSKIKKIVKFYEKSRDLKNKLLTAFVINFSMTVIESRCQKIIDLTYSHDLLVDFHSCCVERDLDTGFVNISVDIMNPVNTSAGAGV